MKTFRHKFTYLMIMVVVFSMAIGFTSVFAAELFGNAFHVSSTTGVNGTVSVGTSVTGYAWYGGSGRVNWYIYKDGSLVTQGVDTSTLGGNGGTIPTGSYVSTSNGTIEFRWVIENNTSATKSWTVNVGGSLVNRTLDSITVSPSTMYIPSTSSAGGNISVNARYTDGSVEEVSNNTSQIVFSSNPTNGAFVSGRTVYAGNVVGTTRINVTYTLNGNSKSNSFDVSVGTGSGTTTPTYGQRQMVQLTLVPNTVTIYGAKQTFGKLTGVANLSDNTSKSITADRLKFRSQNPDIAYVDNDGNLRSGDRVITNSTTRIFATYNFNGVEKEGYTDVSVIPHTNSSREITRMVFVAPNKKVNGLNNIGGYIKTRVYYDKERVDITSYTNFRSSDPQIAYVSNGFIYSGSKYGTAKIYMDYEDWTIWVNVQVVPVLERISIEPTNSVLDNSNSGTAILKVMAYYSDKTSIDVTQYAFLTSNGNSMVYIEDGVVSKGTGTGSATISAYYRDKSISTTIVVR